MDFAFTEDQEALRELVYKILSEASSHERLTELEASGLRHDPSLWADLGRADLLDDHGFVETCIVLEQAGRTLAPAPLLATLVLGAEAGGAGAIVSGTVRGTDLVPSAPLAERIVVRGDGGSRVVDRSDVRVEPVEVMSREPYGRVVDAGAGETVDTRITYEHVLVALCAMQVGVSDEALRRTAAYVSERVQFGRPIGAFQAVHQRIADAYIALECLRWTTWQAAWLLSEGLPAGREARIARFWACDAGPRVAATAQQFHGGLGVDLDYPLHRYFFWTKQLELLAGSAPVHLAEMGESFR